MGTKKLASTHLELTFTRGSGFDAWPDLKAKDFIRIWDFKKKSEDNILRIAVIDDGTTNGEPAIAFRFELPDGRTVIAETTAKLFIAAAHAIDERYPDLMPPGDIGEWLRNGTSIH